MLVGVLCCDEFVVCVFFDDVVVFYYEDEVGVVDG